MVGADGERRLVEGGPQDCEHAEHDSQGIKPKLRSTERAAAAQEEQRKRSCQQRVVQLIQHIAETAEQVRGRRPDVGSTSVSRPDRSRHSRTIASSPSAERAVDWPRRSATGRSARGPPRPLGGGLQLQTSSTNFDSSASGRRARARARERVQPQAAHGQTLSAANRRIREARRSRRAEVLTPHPSLRHPSGGRQLHFSIRFTPDDEAYYGYYGHRRGG